jgi:hypothetical protein
LLVERGMPGPNYAWNGLGLLADIASGGISDTWRESLVAGLLAVKGIALDDASPVGQNNRLQSWSWTEGTFSWIEPTALCVLALKKARASGPLARTRLHEAEAMMFDRVCATGGWNYGNAEVLGQDLRPYVPTTALTLLALQDRRDHPAVVKSLSWLRSHATAERSTMALSLATICLQIFGETDHSTRTALEDQLSSPDTLRGVHVTAMGLCALSSEQGFAGLTVV